MKKKFLVAFMIVCTLILVMGIINASAESSGTCGDNLTWILDDGGTLTISGTGDMTSWSSESSVPWCSDRTSIKSVVIGEDVTTIGSYAFYKCTYLTEINWNAKNVSDFSSSNYVFCQAGQSETGISVIFGKNVETIPANAFYSMWPLHYSPSAHIPKITSITIGESVTTIGSYAFYMCLYLTEINWNAKNVSDFSSSNYVFYQAGQSRDGIRVTFGENVETIPAYAFYPYSPPSGNSPLNYTPKITDISIGESVTAIGPYAFYYCNGLTNVTMGESVAIIGERAFYNCRGITSIVIPDSVTTIGSYAFYSCDRLTSVYISDLVAWCKIEFSNGSSNPLYHAKNLYFNGQLITNLNIPETIEEIGSYTFNGCSSITSVTLHKRVTTIGVGAFGVCRGLTSIAIPESVITIGDSAFNNCTDLKSITMGDTVTKIGRGAFFACDSLTYVYYNGTEEEWNAIIVDDWGNEDLTNNVRFVLTKTTVSEDGKTFTVAAENVEFGKNVILGLYDNNKLIEMQSAIYEGFEIPFTTTKTYTNAKVMVWDDLTTLKPICVAEIVK